MTLFPLVKLVSTALLLQFTVALSDEERPTSEKNGNIRGSTRKLAPETKSIDFAPFEIELFPVIDTDSDEVLSHLQDITFLVLMTRFENQVLPEGVSFESVELPSLRQDETGPVNEDRDRERLYNLDDFRNRRLVPPMRAASTITFKGGSALFEVSPEAELPTTGDVMDWVKSAINEDFRKFLKSSEYDYNIESVSYTQLPEIFVPTEAPKSSPEETTETVDVPVEVPDVPVEAPDVPLEAPDAPVEAPDVPLEAPDAPVEAPDVPVEAPDVPLEAPDVPVEAPDVPLEAPDMPVEAPDVPVEAPDVSSPNPTESFLASAASKDVNDTSNIAPLISCVVGGIVLAGISVLLFVGHRRRQRPYKRMSDSAKPKLQRTSTNCTMTNSDYGEDTMTPQSDYSLDGSSTNFTEGTSRSPDCDEDPPLTLLVSCTLSSPSSHGATDSDIVFESSDDRREAIRIAQPSIAPPYARSRRETEQIVLDEVYL